MHYFLKFENYAKYGPMGVVIDSVIDIKGNTIFDLLIVISSFLIIR